MFLLKITIVISVRVRLTVKFTVRVMLKCKFTVTVAVGPLGPILSFSLGKHNFRQTFFFGKKCWRSKLLSNFFGGMEKMSSKKKLGKK